MADRLQALTRQGHAHVQALLAGAEDPHAEVLALVWGPRFDRDHARHLAAPLAGRHPQAAGPVLDALMDVGERFDRLEHAAQQRIRRLILRHRALSDALH
ncbi:MAG: hypothetical protein JNK28_07515 [Burkholderiaceae bacterium]|nr:hypothetical protein [Burkholderiaceae bacterium]